MCFKALPFFCLFLAVGFFGSSSSISVWKFASRAWKHPKAETVTAGCAAAWGEAAPVLMECLVPVGWGSSSPGRMGMSLHVSEPPWASPARSEANNSPVFLACLNTSGVVAIARRRSPWRAGCLCWRWSRGLRRDLHVLLFLAPQLHAAANFDLVSFFQW